MFSKKQINYSKTVTAVCIILLSSISCEEKIMQNCTSLETCTSRECVHHAKTLHDNMKPDADPCTDFYSFACGGYRKKHEKETKTVYDDMWLSLQKRIKNVLDNLKTNEDTSSRKMKEMYDSCMNIEYLELKSLSDALQFLSEVGIPDWPMLNDDFEFSSLSEVLGKLAAYGEFAFFKFQASPYKDIHDQENRSLTALILPNTYLLDSKLKYADVEDSIIKILKYFKFDKPEASNILKNFKAVEDLGIKLRNEQSEETVLCKSDLKLAYAKLNCSQEMQNSLEFLCSFWKSAIDKGDLRQTFLADTLHVSCRWSRYMENTVSALGNFTHKSLAYYVSLRFFFSHLEDMNLYFRRVRESHSGVKDSKHKAAHPIDRWQYCVGWVIKSLSFVLGYEYSSKVMTEPEQNDVLNMIQQHIEELKSLTSKQNWISTDVKTYLTAQLGKMKTGFKSTVKNYRNVTFIDSYYKRFNPRNESFLKNILEFKRLLNPAVLNTETSFSSFYSTSDSYNLDFGFSLFFPPAYSYGLPKEWKYAAIGWIISHELIHNLKLLFEVLPLDSKTEDNYLNKTECYISQYLQFLKGKAVKQVLSSEAKEEIIADNIGWELTEKAIEKYFNKTDASYLPSLENNPRQLTYLSFAQVSCESMSKEIENEFYHTKPHNLQNLRVTGVLQNSRIFSQTFECSESSPMNSKKKCVFFE